MNNNNKDIILILLLILCSTLIISNSQLKKDNQILKEDNEQLTKKANILDNINNQKYTTDGYNLEPNQLYNIHFRYNINDKNYLETWELYIDNNDY